MQHCTRLSFVRLASPDNRRTGETYKNNRRTTVEKPYVSRLFRTGGNGCALRGRSSASLSLTRPYCRCHHAGAPGRHRQRPGSGKFSGHEVQPDRSPRRPGSPDPAPQALTSGRGGAGRSTSGRDHPAARAPDPCCDLCGPGPGRHLDHCRPRLREHPQHHAEVRSSTCWQCRRLRPVRT